MSQGDFIQFHNEVFNLPRDSFSNFNLLKIKSIAEYLYCIKNNFSCEGLSIVEIYVAVHYFLQSNKIENPNEDFENLFDLRLDNEESIKDHYKKRGREFRHWMEFASLLELLGNIELGNKRSKRFVTSFAEELYLSPIDLILPLIRDKVLSINTKTNPGIGNLSSYELYRDLNFKPAMAILKYLHLIHRPCTKFELSIFFGRPDHSLHSEEEIVKEALRLGTDFPTSQDEQMEHYFRLREWVDTHDNIYSYIASQQPYFKFNSFFILMKGSSLINIYDDIITLSEYSLSLFDNQLVPEAVEIEKLLDEIEKSDIEGNLAEKVAKNRSALISDLIESDENFLTKINYKASQKSGKYYTTTENTHRKRDELIREASKHLAEYECQGCRKETFPTKNGINYVESHHIIEYNDKEDGPDVLQNLLVLCSNCHAKIHFARIDIIEDFYKRLREEKIITLEQFKEIHTNLKLLKEKHIKVLLEKKIIYNEEARELLELIN